MRALVAQEPGRADLRVDLAISCWNLYLLAPPQDERHWLEQVLETLRPLRERGAGPWPAGSALGACKRVAAQARPQHLNSAG